MADPVIPNSGAAAPPAWHAELSDWPHLTANGWDKLDGPVAAATIAKSYRELQKLHGGINAGNVVKIPDPGSPNYDADAAAFWERMGTPKEAAAYKLDELKHADGSTLDPAYAEAARTAAANAKMPAAMLDTFLKGMIPQLDNAKAATAAAQAVAVQENRRALDAAWGPDVMKNKFLAGRAMDALAIPPAALEALESLPGVGYKGIMEMMLKLATQMGEARFVSGSVPNNVMDAGQAQAQLSKLMGDPAWQKRWTSDNDSIRETAIKEKNDLIRIITGS